MTALGADDFPGFFKSVHGYDPFPWQARLARQVVERGCWPSLLDLPTGAGKTAAIDIAVFHLACEATRGPARRAPLRMLFVIDRRIVVDAAADRAKQIRDALASERRARHPVLAEVARRLSLLSGDEEHPLDIVRLRGGAPQERDWARSPAQPLVVISTVDQVGSRLLFRGYGVSPRMWPVHAGLVGADALWLLDEVHLSRPFEQTLRSIELGHPQPDHGGVLADQPRLSPFAVVRLSATPGDTQVGASSFTLSDDDRAHSGLRPRLVAHKRATLLQIDKEPDLALADGALSLLRPSEKPGRRRKKPSDATIEEAPALLPLRLAVVVNRVDLARRTFERIAKIVSDQAEVVLLTGRVRPLDRDRIIARLQELRLFAERGRDAPVKPVILVATQTIEAGADLDVDALVTEIAPLDCLRQRFGRLDRLGERGESRAVILVHKKSSKDWKTIEAIYGDAARATADWLDGARDSNEEIDFGIDAFEPRLHELGSATSETKLEGLLARRADAPVLLPVYAELWATTWPAPAATPEPALFLHGPGTSADVQIVWRADVHLEDEKTANISLDLCPPASLETLSVPVRAAQRWLGDRANAQFADVPERTPEHEPDDGLARGSVCLRYDRTEPEGKRWAGIQADKVKAGDQIVVPCEFGGYDQWGWNPESEDEVTDLGVEAGYLQRLTGIVRITPATLTNALRHEGRQDESAFVWDELRRALPEEGEEGEAAGVIANLQEQEVALPHCWLMLLAGRERMRGIKDRRARIASYGNDDWSSGCLLYAEKTLDAGLLDELAGEGPEGAEATTERDDSSRVGESVSLARHLRHVEQQARAFATRAGLSQHLVEIVVLAARLHDLGKAEPRFQADLHGRSALARMGFTGLAFGELLAKSERGEGRRGGIRSAPEGFRHEALSVALAATSPEVTALDEADRDLLLWLIGTHHGYGRPFFPAMIDNEPEGEVFVPEGIAGAALRARTGNAPLRLDQDWVERADRLVQRFGPWELARLEAILRLADHAASRAEQDGSARASDVADKATARRDPISVAPQPPAPPVTNSLIALDGLEPDNLLAYLALLGLLRALETAKPEWRPRIAWRAMPMVVELHLAASVDRQEMLTAADVGVRSLARAYQFDCPDITYSPKEFRTLAERVSNDRGRARLIAALASDGAVRRDGDVVEPTSLCAMFGQGHQHFLTRLASMATRDDVDNVSDLSRALFERWRYDDETEGFRWDPMEDRRYAHQYGDPSEGKNKIGTVTGANRLAAIGFGLLASVPTSSGLVTIGISGSRRGRDVCWPLVAVPSTLVGHLDLVAHPSISDDKKAADLARYGVLAIARARRYQVGKFFNFERASVQRL